MTCGVDLKVDWCSPEAAKHAVMTWHYSKRMPMPPLVRVGAWENGQFIGCVLFGRGANYQIGAPYGLKQTECVELLRIALRDHVTPVTRIVSVALRFLSRSSPALRLVVSYADPAAGHHGGIYQGGNWIYVGTSAPTKQFFHEGRWKHNREVTGGAFGGLKKSLAGLKSRVVPGKHKYLMPLDSGTAAVLQKMRKPYPKKILRVSSADGGTPGDQPGGGGSNPTETLR